MYAGRIVMLKHMKLPSVTFSTNEMRFLGGDETTVVRNGTMVLVPAVRAALTAARESWGSIRIFKI